MTSFTDIVQKAFYLGVGIAAYAGEKASSTLVELRGQAQEIVDELVNREEMTTEKLVIGLKTLPINLLISRLLNPRSLSRLVELRSQPRMTA